MNYYVTQMPSGHGYFRKYLHAMGKTASPLLTYDGGEVFDVIIETITAANIVRVMIANTENWTSVAYYVERILRLNESDRRLWNM